MPLGDELSECLAPLVEWVVFRFRRIVVTTMVMLLCLGLLAWAWTMLSASGRSPLQGRVSVAGRPVTFGSVTIVTADGTTLTTSIQRDGSYRLPHVPAGTVRIAVSSPDPLSVFQKATATPAPALPPNSTTAGTGGRAGNVTQKEKPPDKGGDVTIAARAEKPPPSTQPASQADHAGWFRIPGRYADPSRSGLRVTVDPRGSTVDLELNAGH